MTNYKNRCIYRTDTAGTGSLVLGELLDGTFFPLSEEDDGKAYNYVLTEGNTACEYGMGVYDHDAQTLTREVEQSTNEDAPIDLSGEGAVLAIGDVSAADLGMLLRRGDDATGLNSTAADTAISPGKSTGNAAPSAIVLQRTVSGASGNDPQSLEPAISIAGRDVIFSPQQRVVLQRGSSRFFNIYSSGTDWYFAQEGGSSGDKVYIRPNSGGSAYVALGSYNQVVIGNANHPALHVTTVNPTQTGLVLQASAAQTENLLEVQNSAGSVLAGVDSSGMLDATNFRAIRLTRSIPAGEGNYAMLGTFSSSAQRGKVLLVSVSQASGSGRDTSAIWLLATASYDRGWHTVGPVASSHYSSRVELDVVVWPNGAGNLSLRLRNTSEDTPLGPVRVVIQALAGRIADDWNESTDTGTTTRPPVAPYHPLWVENGRLGVGKASPTEKLDVSGSVAISDQLFISDKAQFDTDTTAGNTRLLLYDVDSGQLQRVKVGPNNSGPGGSGRALYVDNTED